MRRRKSLLLCGATHPLHVLRGRLENVYGLADRFGAAVACYHSVIMRAKMESAPYKPSRTQLLAAVGKTVPDVIGPGLHVLFCGINPGLYSGATSHHFARPGNRFWPVLHEAGFTQRQLAPWEEQELLSYHCGITNLVARATASADELKADELVTGRGKLLAKVNRYAPRFVAVLGITAYRGAFEQPKATLGQQHESFGDARVWVLPNPSGLNAHHQLKDLTRLFRALREAACP
jgi:TDG/mug DNA glycosylase family protein